MTTSKTEAEVHAALYKLDPSIEAKANLARQLLMMESTLSVEVLGEAIARAGFLAVPQRRQSDRIERADVMRLAERTVAYAVAALYIGAVAGIFIALMRISTGRSTCGLGQGCDVTVAMISVGFALLCGFLVGGLALYYGTLRLYRRIAAERYLRATRRGAGERISEDGTSGYAWVGRRAA